MTAIVVTACDGNSNYFPLLRGMVESLQVHAPGVAIGVIDCRSYYPNSRYLTRAQRAWLHERGVIVRRDPETADQWENVYRQLVWRCRLPELFPGYETVMHLDADAWLQTPGALQPYLDGAREFDVAAVSDFDRHVAYTSFGSGTWQDRLATKYYGEAIANRMRGKPMLFGTSFAARSDSRFWRCFARSMQTAWLSYGGKKPEFGIDQIALSETVITNRLRVALLPFRCCYHVGYRLPRVNTDGLLVEPYPPYDPLEIVHVIGDHKYVTHTLTSLAGQPVTRDLHFSGGTNERQARP